jgi:GntR family transcriptional repressor for pyruvate dehydrogenase complex
VVLNKDTLTRQAFNSLVDHIIRGGLRPGDDLPSTSALIEEFGISRPVVREALSALQACGFVDIRNGRTPVVGVLDGRLIEMFVARAAQLQARPMSGLMEVRVPLEIQSARLAAARADDEAIRAVEAANRQMAASLKDAERYPQLDTAFHSSIAAAANNPILSWMIHSIRSELMTVMTSVRAYREAHGLVGQEQQQHDEIAAAIMDRDPDRAAAAMEHHLTSSVDLVQSVEGGVNGRGTLPKQRRGARRTPPAPPHAAETGTAAGSKARTAGARGAPTTS